MGKTMSKLRRRKQQQPGGDNATIPRGSLWGQSERNSDGANAKRLVMRAVCDFEANCDGDLSFKRGDTLEVLEQHDEWWWRVRHFETGTMGFAPKQFLQTTDDSQADSLDCWFDIDRLESERLLRMPGLENGTYLLRPHQKRQAERENEQQLSGPSYTLSVRCSVLDDDGTAGFIIRHYRVMPLDSGAGFYVSTNRTFQNLADLVRHYQNPGEERSLVLSRPCPRVFTPPPNFRDFEINRNQLELIEKIGSGSFGEVYRAKFGPVFEVAVKRMLGESVTVSSDFVREARIMHGLHHPKIVQLIGVCTEIEPVYIVTEYMPLGSLKDYVVQDRERHSLGTEDMFNYLQQVADGMSYLEQRNYIHCDLRAANILVASRQMVKVADFGLARLVESGYYRKSNNFPVRWSAPECFAKNLFTIKSDVWSFGVVIFEVLSRGDKPYKSWRNSEMQDKLLKGTRMQNNLTDYGIDQNLADRIYECMLLCWNKTPKQRPTFLALKEIFEDFSTNGGGGYAQAQAAYRQSDPIGQSGPIYLR